MWRSEPQIENHCQQNKSELCLCGRKISIKQRKYEWKQSLDEKLIEKRKITLDVDSEQNGSTSAPALNKLLSNETMYKGEYCGSKSFILVDVFEVNVVSSGNCKKKLQKMLIWTAVNASDLFYIHISTIYSIFYDRFSFVGLMLVRSVVATRSRWSSILYDLHRKGKDKPLFHTCKRLEGVNTINIGN